MNIWNNTILTEKGLALMAKLTQGTSLEITRAATGAGFVTPGMLVKETDVTGLKQELAFRPASYPETGKCAITVALRNDGLAIGYTATQVGMFAMDPDEGEILLMISQSNDATSGTIVPSEKEMPGFSSEWTFYLQYGQADGVTVVVDPSNTVTRAEMEEYVAEEAAAGRTMTGDIDMGGHKISNVADPTLRSDVATKGFVEDFSIEGSTYVAVDENKDGNVILRPYVPLVDDFGTEDKDNPGCYFRMVGDEKEWINPPMLTGVEYRTTERHYGKPVYTTRIEFSPTTDDQVPPTGEFQFNHNIPNIERCFRCNGFYDNGFLPWIGENGFSYIAHVNRHTVLIRSKNSNWNTSHTIVLDAYYTKTN